MRSSSRATLFRLHAWVGLAQRPPIAWRSNRLTRIQLKVVSGGTGILLESFNAFRARIENGIALPIAAHYFLGVSEAERKLLLEPTLFSITPRFGFGLADQQWAD